MLSGILNSPRAIKVNIEIMRAFVRLRGFLASNKELTGKLAGLEKKYDAQFKVVFDAIRQLMTPTETKKGKIGFLKRDDKGLAESSVWCPRNSPHLPVFAFTFSLQPSAFSLPSKNH